MKSKTNFAFIVSSFFTWRVLLFVLIFLGIYFLPAQENFLAGGKEIYSRYPWGWGWANFDGEHYMAIAKDGYRPLTYFFFPFYPALIKFFALGSRLLASYLMSGLFVSHTAFLLGLIGFWKLASLDYKESTAKLAIFLLLLFPTSFYFVSVYTESLFFALTVWSFVYARKGSWIRAGLLGAAATATRIVGLALLPALLIEAWQQRKNLPAGRQGKVNPWSIVGIALVPLGLLVYMYFLKVETGDPLNFLNTLGIFGEQRSESFVLLPQVFYRYIFKVLPNLNYSKLTLFFPGVLEFAVASALFGLSILAFWKTRLSYAIYLATAFLIPTLAGSFSSMPRYALVLFPAFLISGQILAGTKKWIRVLIFSILTILLGIATAMFTRGYWIS